MGAPTECIMLPSSDGIQLMKLHFSFKIGLEDQGAERVEERRMWRTTGRIQDHEVLEVLSGLCHYVSEWNWELMQRRLEYLTDEFPKSVSPLAAALRKAGCGGSNMSGST